MEDVIKKAEEIANQTKENDLSMTQLRKFLASVNSINNKLLVYQSQTGAGKDLETLPDDLANEIRYLEVKLVYQGGRDKKVKEFVEEIADLRNRIKAIGKSRKKYEEFAKLIEAIVAFHRFKGGKD